MDEKGKPAERERRDWTIILIILLLGFLCVILAGERAIRFSPNWKLDTNMRSNLDPDSDFLTNKPVYFYEPLDPSILTQPVWVNVFLTPGALFETRTPLPLTNTPLGTNTPVPTLFYSPTTIKPTNTPAVIIASPTNTSFYYPPPPTNTPKPPPTNTPLPSTIPVDLQVTKTDSTTTYTPGATVTYTIVVTNNGANNVTGATISDPKPAQVTTWGWCVAPCTPVANSNTDLSASFNLASSASVTYRVSANINAGATGNLVNIASASVPSGYTDTVPGNNSATDTDTLVLDADLQVTKTDNSSTYTPGSPVTYTIVVSNAGPNAVTGANVTDTLDATRLNNITWTCIASGSAFCTTSGSGNISDTVNLPVGTTVTYTVNAGTNNGATGNLTNTATVDVPSGYSDPTPGNNTATDTDTPVFSADLQITKTDNSTDYVAGALKIYTIRVSNAGPSNVTGATVTDIFSTNTNVSGAAWGCLGTGGATCTLVGLGDINDTVNLPAGPGSYITYTVFVNVSTSPLGDLVNTGSVAEPAGVIDSVPGNNSATDTDTLIVAIDISTTNLTSLPPPYNNGLEFLPDGGMLTLSLSTPVVVGSHAGWDLTYFEQDVTGSVFMDQIILQIGDGSNWYTILYWGDGNADSNTNVSIPLVGNSGGTCAGEPDNCVVDGTLLSPDSGYTTGITIDVDLISPAIPAGSYNYLRIIEPNLGSADGVSIDGIYVWP